MKWLRKNTRMNNDPNCPFYQIEVKDLNQKTIFPWEDVLLSEYYLMQIPIKVHIDQSSHVPFVKKKTTI